MDTERTTITFEWGLLEIIFSITIEEWEKVIMKGKFMYVKKQSMGKLAWD